MGFSTKECAWEQTSVKVLNRTLVGIQGFEFNKTVDKQYLKGAGSDPIDIQSGDKEYPGSIDLLKYEVDMLNDAAVQAGYADILEVPHEAILITCTFKKLATDAPRRITAAGVAFTSLKAAMKANDKSTVVNLPFISMKINFR